jgi:hypothetical protein
MDGGNHTPGFEQAAGTIEAHYACLDVSKALAATGVRVIIDDDFFAHVRHHLTFNPVRSMDFFFQVKKTFEEDKAVRDAVVN